MPLWGTIDAPLRTRPEIDLLVRAVEKALSGLDEGQEIGVDRGGLVVGIPWGKPG